MKKDNIESLSGHHLIFPLHHALYVQAMRDNRVVILELRLNCLQPLALRR